MNHSIAHDRRLYRIARFAPSCALAAFLCAAFFGPWGSAPVARSGSGVRLEHVERSMSAIPYRLGAWVGVDIPLPSAAIEILHSLAVVSRTYSNLSTGERASLAIVYCDDVRDMLGHHPPRCYPAAGWTLGSQGQTVIGLQVAQRAVEANLFRFEMNDGSADPKQISIVGFFVLPGVGITHDAAIVSDRAGRRALSSEGSGQVQVVVDGWQDQATIVRLAEDLLSALPPETFAALLGDTAGGQPEDDGKKQGEAAPLGSKSPDPMKPSASTRALENVRTNRVGALDMTKQSEP